MVLAGEPLGSLMNRCPCPAGLSGFLLLWDWLSYQELRLWWSESIPCAWSLLHVLAGSFAFPPVLWRISGLSGNQVQVLCSGPSNTMSRNKPPSQWSSFSYYITAIDKEAVAPLLKSLAFPHSIFLELLLKNQLNIDTWTYLGAILSIGFICLFLCQYYSVVYILKSENKMCLAFFFVKMVLAVVLFCGSVCFWILRLILWKKMPLGFVEDSIESSLF